MADESENGNEQDFEAPIWNEDRTAMIQYVDILIDREFGGKKYNFIFLDRTGWFVLSKKNSSFSFDEYLSKMGYTDDQIFDMEYGEYKKS